MTAPAGYAVLWEFEGRTCVIDFDGEDALSISIGFAVALAEADEPRTNIRHVQIRLPELTEAEQARIALVARRQARQHGYEEAAHAGN